MDVAQQNPLPLTGSECMDDQHSMEGVEMSYTAFSFKLTKQRHLGHSVVAS